MPIKRSFYRKINTAFSVKFFKQKLQVINLFHIRQRSHRRTTNPVVDITRVGDQDPRYFFMLDPDPHERQNTKVLEVQNRAVDAHTMEACRLKMEPRWVYRPVAADSDHFEEGEPDRSSIRIRITMKDPDPH